MNIKHRLGDKVSIAVTLHQLGTLAQIQGDPAEAWQLYKKILAIKRQVGNQSGIALTLHALDSLAQAYGDHAEAHSFYSEALAIYERLGSSAAAIARELLKSLPAH